MTAAKFASDVKSVNLTWTYIWHKSFQYFNIWTVIQDLCMFKTVLHCFHYRTSCKSQGSLQSLYLFSFSPVSKVCSLPSSKMLLFYPLRHWEINGEIFRNAQHFPPLLSVGTPSHPGGWIFVAEVSTAPLALSPRVTSQRINQCQWATAKARLGSFHALKIYQNPIGRSFLENKNLHFIFEHLAGDCVNYFRFSLAALLDVIW